MGGDATPAQIRVSVVYALPDRHYAARLTLPPGATVDDAVTQSGLRRYVTDAGGLQCAIYGRVVPLSQALVEGDRVEILRPLEIDPKENRRRAASKERQKR